MLTELVPRGLVDVVMDRAGRREEGVQLLPARGVVYSVPALCLFFGDGFEDVVAYLWRRGVRTRGEPPLVTCRTVPATPDRNV
ncbi:transposase domain-containing protein [Streptomyces sp. NPDC001663]|uniref:transposase domain-containing protein n=1 Tax=Streptomyces sp. NPDC001663 TaxID=3364597 RepID=UPI0036B30DCC